MPTTPTSIRRCASIPRRLKTNTVSNTAFRGFGGPQGMMFAERMMDAIAIRLGLDPLDVRKRNFYGEGRDLTPYGSRSRTISSAS